MITELLGLNERQAQALDIDERGIIAAGAGAGKTQTLAALVCRDLIDDNIAPERVAICTFTRSAASKLTGRVAQQLARLDVPSDQLPDVSRLYAGTIDALCGRLLRENALHAHVPPGFRVGDDRLLMASKREAFSEAIGQLPVEDLVLLGGVADPESDLMLTEVVRALDLLRVHGDPRHLEEPDAPTSRQRQRLTLADDCQTVLDYDDATGKYLVTNLTKDIQALRDENLDGFSSGKYGIRESHPLYEQVWALGERIARERQLLVDETTWQVRRAAVRLLRQFAVCYSARKEAIETLDFLDLALKADLFLSRPQRDPSEGFLRLYIDEAQDTSPLQLKILDAMLAQTGVRISVGDENQSIYSFRKADVRGFRRQASQARQRTNLTQNYRSQPSVMRAINAICSRVPELRDGLIVMDAEAQQVDEPHAPSVEIVQLLDSERTLTAREEADVVAAHTLQTRDQLNLNNRDICVLCEANSDGAAYADAFRALGVPALLVQKRGLLAREECLDLLAYLRLLDDPDNEEALVRTLSSPLCGLSDMQLHALAAHRPRLEDRQDSERRRAALAPLAFAAAPQFAARHQRVLAHVGRVSVTELAHIAVEEHGFLVALELADPTGALRRNVEKLIALIGDTESREHGPALRSVLNTLDAEREAGIDEGQDATIPSDVDAVRIMTIHNAKGDEFPLVVIGRLSKDDRTPSSLLAVHDGQLGVNAGKGLRDSQATAAAEHDSEVRRQEKRRLFYVALTRAQRHLILAASARTVRKGPSWRGMAKWLFDTDGALSELNSVDDPDRIVQLSGHPINGRTPPPARMRVVTPDLTQIAVLTQAARQTSARDIDGDIDLPEEFELAPLPLIGQSLSYTQLTRWERCSLRRNLEHDRGLVGSRGLPAANGSGGRGARRLGLTVHALLAEHDWQNQLTAADDLRVMSLPDHQQSQLTELLNNLNKSPWPSQLQDADRIFSERRFSCTLGGHTIIGAVDVLAFSGDRALVIDWKTGDDEEGVFVSDYALQRRLYAFAALASAENVTCVEAATVHLTDGVAERETWTAEQLPALQRELVAHLQRLMVAPAVAAASTAQPFCESCPGLRFGCPVARTVS
jgi:ATP-dependent helicase/nuclease subunit A